MGKSPLFTEGLLTLHRRLVSGDFWCQKTLQKIPQAHGKPQIPSHAMINSPEVDLPGMPYIYIYISYIYIIYIYCITSFGIYFSDHGYVIFPVKAAGDLTPSVAPWARLSTKDPRYVCPSGLNQSTRG